jgi:hypothetical protein
MWFIFITARLFIFRSFQPRLAAALLRSCSVVNSPTRRAGLSPAFQPASLAQPLIHLSLALPGRPGGTPDNSQAFQRLESDRRVSSPEGTADSGFDNFQVHIHFLQFLVLR